MRALMLSPLFRPPFDPPAFDPPVLDPHVLDPRDSQSSIGDAWMKARQPAMTGACRSVVLVRRGEILREQAEACIREVYRDAFDASIPAFPELLATTVDSGGQPVCAAGLRTEADGFFSEDYLDRPVEQVLGALAGRDVERGRIFEVTTLASRRVAASPDFVRQIASLGKSAGFEWSVFTATSRLRTLLRRLGLPLVVLGRADPARIEDAGRWGSYYSHAPMICAVDDQWLDSNSASSPARPCHA